MRSHSMALTDTDAALLWDMRKAAREVVSFVEGIDLASYEEDLMRQRAVERSVEIIGEAARGLSEPFRSQHPEVEWRAITATRHILAHEYAAVIPGRLWRIATEHVPTLIERLEAILPDETDAGP